MDALEASGPADNVAQFILGVESLEREAHALRRTGSPSHLPAIKGITQKLVSQATMFKIQSKAAAMLGNAGQVRASDSPQG